MKMLRLVSFCHVWFLQIVLIHSHENSTGLAGPSRSGDRFSSPPVFRVLVPEDHGVCLRCGRSGGSDVVWTRRGREVLRGQRYRVLPDGELCLQQLDDSDSGQYRCDGRLAARLQVLTGSDFVVFAGWTLLLPCSLTHRSRQRWFHRRRGGRREPIFTRFRNGTVRPEREGKRLSFGNDALQILDLQPEDAGEYQCGEMQVRVTAVTPSVLLDPTSAGSSSATIASPVVTETDEAGTQTKGQRSLENALLLVAAVALGIAVLLLALGCVSLANLRRRRPRKSGGAAPGHEDTELQLWTTRTQTDYEHLDSWSIHYASLGRQNQGERASRTPPDQNHQGVVYSSVVTRQ